MERFAKSLRKARRARDYVVRKLFPHRRPRKKHHTVAGEVVDFFHLHTRALFMALIVLLVTASLVIVPKTSATVSVFYPGACIGDWAGASNAGNEPALPGQSPASMFTEENSAFLNNSHGDLTCSNFIGNIPGGSAPKIFKLKFHWSFDDGSVVHDGSIHDDTSNPSTDADAGAKTETSPSSTDETSVTPGDEDTETSPASSNTDTNTDTETPPTSSDENVTPAESEDEAVVPSDTTETPASSETETPVPAEDTSVSAPEEITAPVETAAAPSEEPAAVSQDSSSEGGAFSQAISSLAALVGDALEPGNSNDAPRAGNEVLEVRYMLDDENWITLGTVDSSNWQSASFDISNPAISDWSDISKLKIGLFSLSQEGTQPAVYVDAMELSVSYDDGRPQEMPTVRVDDPSIEILNAEKDNFTLDDAPTFLVIDPQLTADDLAALVQDNKATVIDDRYGVLAKTREAAPPAETPSEPQQEDTSVLTPPDNVAPDTETGPDSSSESEPDPSTEAPTETPSETPAETPTETQPEEPQAPETEDVQTPAPSENENVPEQEAVETPPSETETPVSETPSESESAPAPESAPVPTPVETAPAEPAASEAPSTIESVISSALGAFANGASSIANLGSVAAGLPVVPENKVQNPDGHTRREFLLSVIKLKQSLKKVFALSSLPNSLLAFVGDEAPPPIDAVVLDAQGQETTIPVTVQSVVVDGQQQSTVTVEKPDNMFRPGKYTLRVTLHAAEANIVTEQDFAWGVLAINVDRSIYQPDTTAYVQMGAVDDMGNTICDADMTLRVTDPSGAVTTYTTAVGSIVREPQCGPNNIISVPDYYAHVPIGSSAGTYLMTLTAVTTNGTRTVHDAFHVDPDVAFDVHRTGPTRVYPGAEYPATMTITAKEDWSGTVVEKMPSAFVPTVLDDVIPYDSMVTEGGDTILTWHLDLVADEPVTIGYTFLPPPISPEFYLLGPLAFYADGDDSETGSPVFEEARRWQIADDATCNATTVGTWNWSDVGAWSCGHVPVSGDVVNIDSGVTVLLDNTFPTGGGTSSYISVTVNGALTFNSGVKTLNTNVITMDGAGGVVSGVTSGTVTMNDGVLVLRGTSGTLITRSNGARFNAGTGTVNIPTTIGSSIFTANLNNVATMTGLNRFYNLSFTATTATTIATFSLQEAIEVENLLSLAGLTGTLSTAGHAVTAAYISLTGSGAGASGATLSAGASVITLNGTSSPSTPLFTYGTGGCSGTGCGTLSAGTSNFVITPDADLTISSAAASVIFYKMTASPSLAGIPRTYTMGTLTTFSDSFVSSPSSSDGLTPRTLILAGTFTGSTGTLVVSNSLDTVTTTSVTATASSFGKLSILSGGIFAPAAGTTLTLTATSSTLMSISGTGVFNAGGSSCSSTIKLNENPLSGLSVNLNSAGFTGSNAICNFLASWVTTSGYASPASVNIAADITMLGTFSFIGRPLALSMNAGSSIITAQSFTIVGGLSSGGSSSFNADSSTIILTGAGTGNPVFVRGTSGCSIGGCGIFNAGTGTVKVIADDDVIFNGSFTFAVTFNNVTFAPPLNANRTYTWSAGTGVLIANTLFASGAVLTVNPTNADSLSTTMRTLTVNQTANLTVTAGTLLVEACSGVTSPTCYATGKFSTSSSNYLFTAGRLDIEPGGELKGNNTSTGTALTFNASSGTILTNNGGKLTADTSKIFIPSNAGGVTLSTAGFTGTSAFYNLQIGTAATATTTLSGGVFEVSNIFTIGVAGATAFSTAGYDFSAGCLVQNSSTAALNATSSTITLYGTACTTAVYVKTGGLFTGGTSTLKFTSPASVKLFSGSFNTATVQPANIMFAPVLTSDITYTWHASSLSSVAPTGNFTSFPTIDPGSLPSAFTLNVAYNVGLTAGIPTILNTFIVDGDGTARTAFNGQNLTTAKVIINTNGRLDNGSSQITVTGAGASGTLWTQNGVMTATASGIGVLFNGAATSTMLFTAGSNVSFPHNIQISNAGFAAKLGANTTVAKTGSIVIVSGTLDTSTYSLTAGFINLASAAGATTINLNASTFTLTGESLTLITKSGAGTATVNFGTSTVKVASASGSPTFTSVVGYTYYDLTIQTEGATVINSGITTSTFLFAVSHKFLITNAPGNTSVFNLSTNGASGGASIDGSGATFQIDAGARFCIQGTIGGTNATCDRGATANNANVSMPTFTTYSFDPDSDVYYLTNVTPPSNFITTISTNPVYGNLVFRPVLTAGRIYRFSSAVSTQIKGDFIITPSGTGLLTVEVTGSTAGSHLDISGDLILEPRVSSTVLFKPVDPTGPVIMKVTAGSLDIKSGGTLTAQAGASAISAPLVILGNMLLESGGSLNIGSSNATCFVTYVGGSWTNNGTLSTSSCTRLALNSGTTAAFGGSGTNSFHQLHIVPSDVGIPLSISNGTPATVTLPLHGLSVGDPITFSTTNTLPSPLVAGDTYYVIASGFTESAFQISSTLGGGAINTTTDGSGTHIVTRVNHLAKEVDFQATKTVTVTGSVAGSFTVAGHQGKLVKLFSSIGGSTWTIAPPLTANNSVTHADVKDSFCNTNTSNTRQINATFTTNDGNNSESSSLPGCWNFGIPYLNLSLSANAVNFAGLDLLSTKFATPGALSLGSGTETEAHQITVATSGGGGYNLFVQGTPPVNGGHTMTAMGCAGVASSPGTEQFGMRLEKTGVGLVSAGSPCTPPNSGNYAGSGLFSFAATASTPDLVGYYAGSGTSTTAYSVRYIANIGPATPTGNYSTALTYIAVGNF